MLTGAVALLFEAMPVLRGGIGNVVWVFAWGTGIALAPLTDLEWIDFTGLFATMESMTRAARAAIPGYTGEFGLQIALGRRTIVATGLRWPGIHWDLPQVMLRLGWVGVALAIVLLSIPWFDRFDPARRRMLSHARRRLPQEPITAPAALTEATAAGARPASLGALVYLSPLRGHRSWGVYQMFVAELRLALKGYPWWWYAVAGGLVVAQAASPLEVSRGPLLTAAWIWPVLLWSAMGAREARYGTEHLIFSAPRLLSRQFPAGWLVGVLIAAVSGGGAGVRLLIARNDSGLLGWLAGALFMPTLALALGVWTGSSRPFEGLFAALWYIGPLNRVPGLDFTGCANGPHTFKDACCYLALTAGLLIAAFFGRRQQLRRG